MCPQTKAEALEMHQYPYISIIGSLMYLALTTRPDIAYAAGVLARFNFNPGLPHWQAAKHVLCYLKSTADHKLDCNGGIKTIIHYRKQCTHTCNGGIKTKGNIHSTTANINLTKLQLG